MSGTTSGSSESDENRHVELSRDGANINSRGSAEADGPSRRPGRGRGRRQQNSSDDRRPEPTRGDDRYHPGDRNCARGDDLQPVVVLCDDRHLVGDAGTVRSDAGTAAIDDRYRTSARGDDSTTSVATPIGTTQVPPGRCHPVCSSLAPTGTLQVSTGRH